MTTTSVQGVARDVAGDVGGLGGAAAGLLFMTAIAGAGRLAEDPFPMPGSSAEVTRTYYRGSARAVRFNVACQALSLAAHARYVVAMARLASQHRTHPQALRRVVLAAGGATVVTLAATQAGLTAPKEQTDSELMATTRRVFVLGGPIHGVAANLSTPAYFRWEPAGWLIPIGRFRSYLLSGVIGIRLAARRSPPGAG